MSIDSLIRSLIGALDTNEACHTFSDKVNSIGNYFPRTMESRFSLLSLLLPERARGRGWERRESEMRGSCHAEEEDKGGDEEGGNRGGNEEEKMSERRER